MGSHSFDPSLTILNYGWQRGKGRGWHQQSPFTYRMQQLQDRSFSRHMSTCHMPLTSSTEHSNNAGALNECIVLVVIRQDSRLFAARIRIYRATAQQPVARTSQALEQKLRGLKALPALPSDCTMIPRLALSIALVALVAAIATPSSAQLILRLCRCSQRITAARGR